MLGEKVTPEQQATIDRWLDRLYAGQKPKESDRNELKAFFDERDEEGYQDFYNHDWAGFYGLTPIAFVGRRLDECLMWALDQGGYYSDDPEDHDFEEAINTLRDRLEDEESEYGYFVREIRDSQGRSAQVLFEITFLGPAGHTDEAFMVTDSIQSATEYLSNQGVLFAMAIVKDRQIGDLFTENEIKALMLGAIEKGYAHYNKVGMMGLAD